MHVLIELHDPSAHWVALAKIVERAEEFPAAWMLVIRECGVTIMDCSMSGEALICEGEFAPVDVDSLEGKTRFLDWLYECARTYGGVLSP
jgi:hypothetical protein